MTLLSVLLTSSVLILVIILLRWMLRGKVSNIFIYALWLVVVVRLLLPVPEFFLEKVAGIEKPWVGSSVSVMNVAVRLASHWEDATAGQGEERSDGESEKLSEEALEDFLPEKPETENGAAGQAAGEAAQKNTGTVQMAQIEETDSRKAQIPENTENLHMSEKTGWRQFGKFSSIPLAAMAGVVWLSGSLLLLCVQVLSEKRFRRRLTECREEINVCGKRAYKVRGMSTPLLFRSRGFTLDIYIPEEIVEQEELVSHVMLHENIHKKHGDIWWGYLRNLLLAAYWFHPLVWVAALCSKKDCEYACDSSVIGQMTREERISYGNSLLSLVQVGREGSPFRVATLMSVKKSELRNRIYLVKRGKRKGVVATVLAAVLITAVCVSTFTDVKAEQNQETETRRQEETSEAEKQQEEPLVQAMGTLQMVSSELTMEKLIEAYNNGELSKWTVNYISKYKNITKRPPSSFHAADLSYQGVDYQMWLFHAGDGELDEAVLANMETGESICIFGREGPALSSNKEISPEALIYHKVLDEEISYTLPEKLLETEDRCHYEKAGRIFCREEKEKYGIYGIRGMGRYFLWNSTGSLSQACLSYRKDEETLDLDFQFRHAGKIIRNSDRRTVMGELGSVMREFRGGKLQSIAGCENMTSLQGLVFTEDAIEETFAGTFPIWFNQKEAGKVTKKEIKETFSNRKLWIICVMDEKNMEKMKKEAPVGYVFVFDAERYTKEQMIALAKSVHLK